MRHADLAALWERGRFVDRLGPEDGNRLQHGVLLLARLDRRHGIGRAVEAADLDARQLAGFLQRRDGAECHLVIAADHANDVGMRLQQVLHLVMPLRPVPIANLRAGPDQAGILAKYCLVAVGTGCGIVVRRRARQLDIVALPADILRPALRPECSAPRIVGHQPAFASPSWLISASTRNTAMSAAMAFLTAPTDPLALAGSRMIRTAWFVIAVSIRLLSVLVSPLRVADKRLVAELLCLRGGNLAFGYPIRTGRFVDDDGHQAARCPGRCHDTSHGWQGERDGRQHQQVPYL
nr:hypothetical protein [uncultured Lichenicoccus sp.]